MVNDPNNLFVERSKENEMLHEIMGASAEVDFGFIPLMTNAMEYIRENEDDPFEIEMSEKFLEFALWFTHGNDIEKNFLGKYDSSIRLLERLLNEGLNQFSDQAVALTPEQQEVLGINGEEEPLSPREIEFKRRCEVFFNIEIDLITLFKEAGKNWGHLQTFEAIEVRIHDMEKILKSAATDKDTKKNFQRQLEIDELNTRYGSKGNFSRQMEDDEEMKHKFDNVDVV